MSSFAAQLTLFRKGFEQKSLDVFRKSARQLCTMVLYRTPVDTGRLRANWIPGISLSTEIKNTTDRSGNGVLRDLDSVLTNTKLGDSLYFVNNLVYAGPIENGWSAQAPVGMLKVSIKSWKAIVDANSAG